LMSEAPAKPDSARGKLEAAFGIESGCIQPGIVLD